MATSLENNNFIKERQSGIELLKVVAIVLIVLSHVIKTLIDGNGEWAINVGGTISSPVIFIIALLKYSGVLGNAMFFVSSAWFLLDKEKTNYQKIMRMVLDIFIISIIWFVPMFIWKRNEIGLKDIVRSFVPTIGQSNWYLTSYILFCFVYPILNPFIDKLSQKKHLIASIILFFAYFVLSFAVTFPWSGVLTFWATIYFVVAYFKKYGSDFCASKKKNVVFLAVAIVLHISLLLLSNYIYSKIGKAGTMKWDVVNNPFVFIIAFTSFNLMKNTKFSSRIINFLSGLSMLVYIIHENLHFRTFVRPLIWEWIYNSFGYNYILLWVFIYTATLFVASVFVALLYRFILEKWVHKLADKLLKILKAIADSFCKKVIKEDSDN